MYYVPSLLYHISIICILIQTKKISKTVQRRGKQHQRSIKHRVIYVITIYDSIQCCKFKFPFAALWSNFWNFYIFFFQREKRINNTFLPVVVWAKVKINLLLPIDASFFLFRPTSRGFLSIDKPRIKRIKKRKKNGNEEQHDVEVETQGLTYSKKRKALSEKNAQWLFIHEATFVSCCWWKIEE